MTQKNSEDMNIDLADRLRQVLLNGKWIANTNFKEQITSINWKKSDTAYW